MPVTEDDLADCGDPGELEDNLAVHVTPWGVRANTLLNECAKRHATLAAKVKAHNKKSEKNKNEKALEGSP